MMPPKVHFLLCALVLSCPSTRAQTAWSGGVFHVERRGVVERSDIVLQQPNKTPQSAMPLGNGRLGLAVWSQDGYTAQLNRGDTFPLRLSPGQVVIPGLQKLTQASDYSGCLNLYDGQFEERGGGMTATTYVTEALDVMVVAVTGADPNISQAVEMRLWPPRSPQVLDENKIGILAETWLDNKEAGASGETFGSLAAITADARDLRVEKSGSLAIKITFRPHPDGSFRILVASPMWRGGDAVQASSKLLASAEKLPPAEHSIWWNHFWEHVGLMKLSSADHIAEYFENLRMIDLYTAAAEGRGRFPGEQAGIGDLFSAFQDQHQWGPSAFWHWNLRMQVSANLGAGAFELNKPYFNLYWENLINILDWTRLHMGGRTGACVPETMRFNGRGYENETWVPTPAINCGQNFKPYYNARTLSTGAEVSLWIWQQYLFTDDLDFLRKNYRLMSESARFLLAYATRGNDGKLHTFPSNAHETQWDVHDPTTDISAMRALFPAVIQAATILHTDDEFVNQLRDAIGALLQWPIVRISSPTALVPHEVTDPDTVISSSYDPSAEIHNTENIGLEPVWPYGLIGDDGPEHALAVRTYLHRPNKNVNDWSYDPVQAARLGLANDFESSLLSLTEKYQAYPSGMAMFVGPEFYVEQMGVVADALQTALVQDYDGLIRIAPAWPKDWHADATVFIQHRSKVHVQIHHGEISTIGINTGATGSIRVRNPWPGQSVEVVDARTSTVILPASSTLILQFPVRAQGAYTVRKATHLENSTSVEPISGQRRIVPKFLGSRSIGIIKSAPVSK
jgi:hypothetical protein